ncbi:hypothetical protein A5893_03595 [Pedobacter psychrophilus]|uniref:Outer membrane insertion C-signal n=1 Tax=Pedobacter psychrophilus TaxID=1826909 RepID=A0A179DN65_9SPHI|nr:hypothetical protein [Pedobacter psychrophilus]OAQ42210.1 hypothetical protein A5893_03595 [Pedobacter psychrophilus]
MKKLILSTFAVICFNITVSAQSNYKTGLGLGLDFGDGATYVGPSLKHFFNANSAGQAEILFANGSTNINALYEYHQQIKGAEGLQWYLGVGPGVYFYKGGSDFAIKPMAGLDYKISQAPISFTFDWRPTLYFGNIDTEFFPGRFGLGFRYTF